MTVELANLMELAVEMAVAAEVLEVKANKASLRQAATLVTADARKQIGTYQPAVGAYPAWEQLAESTEEEKARIGAPENAPLYRFGELRASFRQDEPTEDSVTFGSVDPVMEYHEFGTIKMPARPALGPALLKNVDRIQQIFGLNAVRAIVGGQRLGYRFEQEEGGIMNSGYTGEPLLEAPESEPEESGGGFERMD
jgi:hypothetical protein